MFKNAILRKANRQPRHTTFRSISSIIAVVLISAITAATFGSRVTPAAQEISLTCSAAISLRASLDEIAKIYEQKHDGARVTFNYGGSGTLQHQIEQGAPVDIFFSAAEKEMDELQKENLLITDTRHDVLRNALVLVVPANSKDISSIQDLTKPAVRKIAVGQFASVPAGMYAQQVLQRDGLLERLQSKIVYAKDVRQVLTYVETGDADAGFVYRTDALTSKTARIALELPDNSHMPIVYPAAVLKVSQHADAAKEFLQFLFGAEAHSIFEKNGFALVAGHGRKKG